MFQLAELILGIGTDLKHSKLFNDHGSIILEQLQLLPVFVNDRMLICEHIFHRHKHTNKHSAKSYYPFHMSNYYNKVY